ncbi:MAG: deoxyribose-phosphate aldolase [Deltaproteobacteria bacterium]|nr:deoxyribose-phosphate aldolase [Deltaproteobacteria bacterium]
MVAPSTRKVAEFIEHTLLKPEATYDEVMTLCEEALAHGFVGVCVNGANVRVVSNRLAGSGVKTVAVVGFPLGAMSARAKAYETKEAVRDGADEVDVVINVGALKDRRASVVLEDLRGVVEAASSRPVKVILETAKLTDEEKVIGCCLAAAAGAAFVKTCTGFGGGKATPDDIALMRRTVGDSLGVKASGGVRTLDDLLALLQAGATRVGTSASVAMVTAGRPREVEDATTTDATATDATGVSCATVAVGPRSAAVVSASAATSPEHLRVSERTCGGDSA